MATYVNDLRLKEIATGDSSGSWGTETNTNLELIAEAMGHGSEAIANASTHTITMADGSTDEFRSTFLRLTGGGQACTVTLAPNTLSHTWIMRNETSAALTLSQGSGANVVIAAGQTKIVATDGAGSGAVVYEMDDLELAGNLAVGGTLGVTGALTGSSTIQGTTITATTAFVPDASDGAALGTTSLEFSDIFLADGAVINLGDDQDTTLTHVADTGILLNSTRQLQFGDSGTYIHQSADGVLDLVSDTEIEINATTIDINGNADISGTIAAGGVVTANAGVVVDNITIDGNEIDVSSGDLTLDAAGDINLDAGGADVIFKNSGTEFGRVFGSSDNFYIQARQSDKDMIFQGIDGGSAISALTLDMSDAGAATFNSTVTATGLSVSTSGNQIMLVDSTGGTSSLQFRTASGSLSNFITSGVGGSAVLQFMTAGENERMRIDASGNVIINEDSNDSDFRVESNSNTHMLFVDAGNDAAFFGGSDKRGFVNIETTAVNYSSGVFNTPHIALQASSQPDDNDGFVGITFATSDSDNYGWSAGAERTSSGVGDFVFTEHNNSATGSEKLRLTQSGAATFTGAITANAGVVVDNITIDGTSIALSSGSLTVSSADDFVVDAEGDINLDANGGDIRFKDNGTVIGEFTQSSNNFVIKSSISDEDLIFQGNDGGSTITALTLDMSDGGSARFAHDLSIVDNGQILLGAGLDGRISSDGTNLNILANNGNLTLDVAGDIFLDADGGNIKLQDAGVVNLDIYKFGGHVYIENPTGDSDIIFQGTDGSSSISMLSLDASAAGAATFNSSVTSAGLHSTTSGTSNFIAGVNAGNSIASGGNYNVCIGDEAGTALTTGDGNVAVGFEALSTEDADGSNTAVGFQALKTLNAGTAAYNTAVGSEAGELMTTGTQNTLIGALCGDAITDGGANVALGYASLSAEVRGNRAVALGHSALAAQSFSSSTANYNVGVGFHAGTSLTTGINNVLVGGLAGDAITDADENTAIGHFSLSANVLGSKSTCLGHGTLSNQNPASATDMYNVAVGTSAGNQITTGIRHTLVGALAGDALTTGDASVAIGYEALSTEDGNGESVAVGFRALKTQNAGAIPYNTAVGYVAGEAVTTGINNTFVGALAGDDTDDGNSNVAMGYLALSANCGDGNTCIGKEAGTLITGSNNTCVGHEAGETMVSATNCLILGTGCEPSGNNADVQLVLGVDATGTGNGNFTIGNGATDSNITLGATVITAPSDERMKEEIETSTAGLSFIKDLRPVTYKWKKEKDIPETMDAHVKDSDKRYMNETTNHGFIAQEVKTAIENHSEIKNGFDMWMERDSDGQQRVAPSALVPILTKAIQEQQALIESLTARITTLEGG